MNPSLFFSPWHLHQASSNAAMPKLMHGASTPQPKFGLARWKPWSKQDHSPTIWTSSTAGHHRLTHGQDALCYFCKPHPWWGHEFEFFIFIFPWFSKNECSWKTLRNLYTCRCMAWRQKPNAIPHGGRIPNIVPYGVWAVTPCHMAACVYPPPEWR